MYDVENLKMILKKLFKKITIYDEMDDSTSRVKAMLRAEDISLVAPFVTKDETIGYLVFGPRRSGNLYSAQDVGLFNIVTNELAVVLQNVQRLVS